jgi:hypothetical protein
VWGGVTLWGGECSSSRGGRGGNAPATGSGMLTYADVC